MRRGRLLFALFVALVSPVATLAVMEAVETVASAFPWTKSLLFVEYPVMVVATLLLGALTLLTVERYKLRRIAQLVLVLTVGGVGGCLLYLLLSRATGFSGVDLQAVALDAMIGVFQAMVAAGLFFGGTRLYRTFDN